MQGSGHPAGSSFYKIIFYS